MVAAGVAIGGRGGDEPDPGERVGEPLPAPEQWRTEYWHDMRVDVPADWGYGGAPMDDGTDDVVACWPSAMVTADGQPAGARRPDLPYVGRPIALTDVCTMYPFNAPDAAAPEGAVRLARRAGRARAPSTWATAGCRRRSRSTAARLTVATRRPRAAHPDPRLGRRGRDVHVRASSPRRRRTCSRATSRGNPTTSSGMTVCAYRLRHARAAFPVADLTYATTVGRDAARQVPRRGGRRASPAATSARPRTTRSRVGRARAEDADGETLRRDVVHLACSGRRRGRFDAQGVRDRCG